MQLAACKISAQHTISSHIVRMYWRVYILFSFQKKAPYNHAHCIRPCCIWRLVVAILSKLAYKISRTLWLLVKCLKLRSKITLSLQVKLNYKNTPYTQMCSTCVLTAPPYAYNPNWTVMFASRNTLCTLIWSFLFIKTK